MSDILEGIETSLPYYGGILFVMLYFLRLWLRGPTTGSDSPKRLDGKVVVITGKFFDYLLILVYLDLIFKTKNLSCQFLPFRLTLPLLQT